MDFRETGWDDIDWIYLAQDRGRWRTLCEHGDEPSSSIKCREVPEWLQNWQLLRKGSVP
jgi:hypothetical protein